MSFDDTKRRLWVWGRWARGSGAIGYPSVSSTERINCGGRTTAKAQADPAIIRINEIIGNSEFWIRKVLINHYLSDATVAHKAGRLRLPKTTYLRWLDDGRWYVHFAYDSELVETRTERCQSPASVGVVTAQPLTGDP